MTKPDAPVEVVIVREPLPCDHPRMVALIDLLAELLATPIPDRGHIVWDERARERVRTKRIRHP